MKKILLNSEWYFKYKTIGNKAADIPGQMITLPHDAMIGLDCSEAVSYTHLTLPTK